MRWPAHQCPWRVHGGAGQQCVELMKEICDAATQMVARIDVAAGEFWRRAFEVSLHTGSATGSWSILAGHLFVSCGECCAVARSPGPPGRGPGDRGDAATRAGAGAYDHRRATAASTPNRVPAAARGLLVLSAPVGAGHAWEETHKPAEQDRSRPVSCPATSANEPAGALTVLAGRPYGLSLGRGPFSPQVFRQRAVAIDVRRAAQLPTAYPAVPRTRDHRPCDTNCYVSCHTGRRSQRLEAWPAHRKTEDR